MKRGIVQHSFQLATRLNSQNPYVTEYHNELWHISLYMNIGNSNWHIWNIDPTNMRFLSLFQFDTRLLTSKHSNLFITQLVEWLGAMLKSWFLLFKMWKMNIILKNKTKYANYVFLNVMCYNMKGCNFCLGCEHSKVKQLRKFQ